MSNNTKTYSADQLELIQDTTEAISLISNQTMASVLIAQLDRILADAPEDKGHLAIKQEIPNPIISIPIAATDTPRQVGTSAVPNATPPLEYGPIPVSSSAIFAMEFEFANSENQGKGPIANSGNYDTSENPKGELHSKNTA